MQIVISDSSCLVDLYKSQLLIQMVNLPFTFAIPQPLFDDELDSISPNEKRQLVALGMQIITLPGEQVKIAQDYSNEYRRVSIYDCFALVVAESTENAILFTGDKALKTIAEEKNIETRGVLWAIDLLEQYGFVDKSRLISVLEQFLIDRLVWLPENEIKIRLKRLRKN